MRCSQGYLAECCPERRKRDERESKEPSLVLRPRAWTRPSKEQESVPVLGALFLVPTLRVHVLGKDHREYEIEREDETRKGLGFGV